MHDAVLKTRRHLIRHPLVQTGERLVCAAVSAGFAQTGQSTKERVGYCDAYLGGSYMKGVLHAGNGQRAVNANGRCVHRTPTTIRSWTSFA